MQQEIPIDPALLSPEQASAAAVERLPTSAIEALKRFTASGQMRNLLGRRLHGAVVAVREHEITAYSGPDEDKYAATRFAWSA